MCSPYFSANTFTVLHVFHCVLTVDTDPPFHAPQPPPSSLCFSSWLFLHVSDAECCSITALTQDFQRHVSAALCYVAFQRERRPSQPSTSLQWAPSHITQIVPLFLMSISVGGHSILGSLDRDTLKPKVMNQSPIMHHVSCRVTSVPVLWGACRRCVCPFKCLYDARDNLLPATGVICRSYVGIEELFVLFCV